MAIVLSFSVKSECFKHVSLYSLIVFCVLARTTLFSFSTREGPVPVHLGYLLFPLQPVTGEKSAVTGARSAV